MFHRMEATFPFQKKPWWAEEGQAASKPSYPRDGDTSEADRNHVLAKDEPELLPWRSRLRNSRLGARLAHGRDSAADRAAEQSLAESSAKASDPKPEASTQASSATEGVSRAKKPAVSKTKNDPLELPSSVGSLPESNRLALAVE
jgi:hypothetical protein